MDDVSTISNISIHITLICLLFSFNKKKDIKKQKTSTFVYCFKLARKKEIKKN